MEIFAFPRLFVSRGVTASRNRIGRNVRYTQHLLSPSVRAFSMHNRGDKGPEKNYKKSLKKKLAAGAGAQGPELSLLEGMKKFEKEATKEGERNRVDLT